MARNVRISIIGTLPPEVPAGQRGQELVDTMIAFWQREIAEVLPDRPDLIILPELSDRFRGLSSTERLHYYEVRGDQILDYYRELARRHRCYVVYPTARPAAGSTWRNAALLIDREGELVGAYHKNHVVVTETEADNILCGREAPVFECDFGRVAIAICFDLNFEELRLKYAAARPDLIVFPSNYHGGLMQAYWAYSCRAHFASALGNVGLLSSILSPLGQTLATTTNYFHRVTATVNLDCCLAHLDFNWERLRALKEKYGPDVEILDPGNLGCVLISSLAPEVTAPQMAQEFGIEMLDDYLERSLAHHHDERNRELPG